MKCKKNATEEELLLKCKYIHSRSLVTGGVGANCAIPLRQNAAPRHQGVTIAIPVQFTVNVT